MKGIGAFFGLQYSHGSCIVQRKEDATIKT